jgi:hypothetical protein
MKSGAKLRRENCRWQWTRWRAHIDPKEQLDQRMSGAAKWTFFSRTGAR